MIHLHIICEGITEAAFAKAMLAPHFAQMGIMLHPAKIGRPGRKGGNVNFDRLLTDIRSRLLQQQSAWCTTFFDYYGLPKDFPGKAEAAAKADLSQKAETICSALRAQLESRIGAEPMRRFIPYVQMHEFEALLFSDANALARAVGESAAGGELARIAHDFDTPEHIDDSPETAPSKRILSLATQYRKATQGPAVAQEIGLPAMRDQCRLFDAWLQGLESLPA